MTFNAKLKPHALVSNGLLETVTRVAPGVLKGPGGLYYFSSQFVLAASRSWLTPARLLEVAQIDGDLAYEFALHLCEFARELGEEPKE